MDFPYKIEAKRSDFVYEREREREREREKGGVWKETRKSTETAITSVDSEEFDRYHATSRG